LNGQAADRHALVLGNLFRYALPQIHTGIIA
jgi:hypothetical protein